MGAGMRILLVGSGGREHALALALANSASTRALHAAPGNPGIAEVAECHPVAADDVAGLVALARAQAIDLVVVGPEVALAAGLADALKAAGIACFGPGKAAARLESSKAFTKDFCARHGIPTAGHVTFDDAAAAKAHVAAGSPPFVIKADGLAAGKGVVIAQSQAEAFAAIDDMSAGKLGPKGGRIVIEDFMTGEEVSVFALCDGERALLLGAAQDHKRAYDGDRGPNTGGMGAHSPAAHVATPALLDAVMTRMIAPTVQGMKAEGAPFVGVLFAGLMVTPEGPRLVEYNVRFGDPECQVLMARFEGDLAALLMACARGRLDLAPPVAMSADAACVVVLAAQGYPDAPLTGSLIRGVGLADALPGVKVLHAGVKRDEDGRLRAAGGRVLGVVARAPSLPEAVARAYEGVDLIDWPTGFHRRDIGARALN
jgi:phosphoribosylamine--glycine ligase